MNVDQALKELSDHHITESRQMLLRWLRQGNKIRASKASNKHGWDIDKDSLKNFISGYKRPTNTNLAEKFDCATKILTKENLALMKENEELQAQLDAVKKRDVEVRWCLQCGYYNYKFVVSGSVDELYAQYTVMVAERWLWFPELKQVSFDSPVAIDPITSASGPTQSSVKTALDKLGEDDDYQGTLPERIAEVLMENEHVDEGGRNVQK